MFTVAALTAADIPTILAAAGGDWWQRDELHWQRCLEQHAAGHRHAVIALGDKTVLGYSHLVWQSQNPGFREANIPEIRDLRVGHQHRRRGVATSIISYLEDRARLAGRRLIGIGVGLYGDYGPAQRLYAKLGYALDGRGMTYDNVAVRPGGAVTVDDALILWLIRDLTHPSPNAVRVDRGRQ
jgi:GNAT superfamily N-acetyltransferase